MSKITMFGTADTGSARRVDGAADEPARSVRPRLLAWARHSRGDEDGGKPLQPPGILLAI